MPGGRYYGVDYEIDWYYVSDRRWLIVHRAQQSFAASQNYASWSIHIVYPAGQWLLERGSHNRRSYDDHRQTAALLVDQMLRQTFGERVGVRTIAEQLFGDIVHDTGIHPFAEGDQMIRIHRRRVELFLYRSVFYVTVGVCGRHVSEHDKVLDVLAQFDDHLGADDIESH